MEDKNKNMQTKFSRSYEFSHSKKQMNAPILPPIEKFPKHAVPNTTIQTENNFGGMTYSAEIQGDTAEGLAEFEVLKSILNREGYLARLIAATKTLGKIFDPSVADLLDLMRIASLDVIEKIIKWREIKKDHDAIFTWNGINYLLKMTSDLDFMNGFLAVKRWIGFSLERNPFCVPFPLEQGVEMFTNEVLSPKHISGGISDGFSIGGMTDKSMARNYSLKKEFKNTGQSSSTVLGSPYLDGATNASIAAAVVRERQLKSSSAASSSRSGTGSSKRDTGKEAQSLILNEDMIKIRQAELIILKEEEKFGKVTRDITGKLVPIDIAEAKLISYELNKDHRRPITEPSASLIESVSLHSASGGVGVIDPPWYPEEVNLDHFKISDKLAKSDKSVPPKQRGKDKVGGLLAQLDSKAAETRVHNPLKPTIISNLEFSAVRKKRTLGDRLAEINELKEQIKQQRLLLEKESLKAQRMSKKRSTSSQNPSRSATPITSRGHTEQEQPPPPSSSLRSKTPEGFDISENLDKIIELTSELDPDSSVKDLVSEPPTSPTQPNVTKEEAPSSPTSPSLVQFDSYLSKASALLLEEEALNKSERDLNIESVASVRRLEYVEKDIEIIDNLKAQQRLGHSKDRSRDIERKRRHLTEEEAKRKGPPPEDDANVYDYFATRIQAGLRGWITRCWFKWYKVRCIAAATSIQSGARGMVARFKVTRMKTRMKSSNDIQRVFRGWRSRGGAILKARNADLGKMVLILQKFWRIEMAKKRVVNKRLLDTSARLAFDVVDTNCLFLSDVKELANRIQTALLEPDLVPLPPDEVLYLIRLVAMMVQEARGLVGLTTYSHMNTRFYGEVDGEHLTWEQASLYINRSERFLRLVRSLAFGPAARPPRVIQVPEGVFLLNQALGNNPRWTLGTFEMMGVGAKCAIQLFKWFSNMMIVASLQKTFIKFLSNSYPLWLPKYMELQRTMRKLEFEMFMHEKCLERIEDLSTQSSEFFFTKEINKKKKEVNEQLTILKEEFETASSAIEKLRNDETSRESYSLISFEGNIHKNEMKLEEYSQEYQNTLLAAEKGNRLSELLLPEVRDRLTIQKLQLTEIKSQYQLLEAQVDLNKGRRRDQAKLPAIFISKAYVIGEFWAQTIIAEIKRDEFLYDAGVTQEFKLSNQLLEKFKVLKKDYEMRLGFKNQEYEAAQEARRQHDKMLMKALEDDREKEEKSKEGFKPSEVELEEERREDDIEAQKERLKKRQGLSDKIMYTYKKRERPVVIAFSRELPAYAKSEIYKHITLDMPGNFVTIDQPDNMGINIQHMQDIIDTHKSIILTVDIGITRLTRESFIRNFDLCLNSLIPKPCVVMVIGEDINRRSNTDHVYGVHFTDLNCMRDEQIKIALQNMASIIYDIGNNQDIRQEMQRIGNELMAPSPSFIITMEALFILHSDHDNYTKPEKTLSSVSWRITRSLLHSPDELANKLRGIVRGSATFHLIECIKEYMRHPSWPPEGSKERRVNRVLDLFASYVEQWMQSESQTHLKGGLPDRSLFKKALKGVSAVVSVIDSPLGSDKFESWKNAYFLTLRAVLQDVRVLKVVTKIGELVHNLNVYREESRVYFDAYCPSTSKLYMCSLSIEDVPSLLTPNATDRDKGIFTTPIDPEDMYIKLVKLLRFENKKVGPKKLICRREYDFLFRITRKINGHIVLIYCYEAALGQLYFEVVLMSFSCKIKLILDDELRMKLLSNADVLLEPTISELEQDARKMLPYIIDRLTIVPSLNNLERLSPVKKTGTIDDRSQGFRLKLRVKGGAGRIMTNFLVHFSGVTFILTLKSSLTSKILRIIIYQPRTKASLELRLNSFQRKIFLGTDNEEILFWIDKLKKRLKLNWRGGHELGFNYNVLKVIRKISGRQFYVTLNIDPKNDSVLVVNLIDPVLSIVFTCSLDKSSVIEILHYDTKPVKAESSSKGKSPDKSIKEEASKIIRKINDKSLESKTRSPIDPAEFENPFENIIKDHSKMIYLTTQLSKILLPKDAGDRFAGYICQVPVVLEFTRLLEPQELLEFNTSLRDTPYLVKIPRSQDIAGVLSSRRQLEVINMETELDILAEEKEKEARLLLEANAKALLELADSLTKANITPLELDASISAASQATTDSILAKLEQNEIIRDIERSNPGITQWAKSNTVSIISSNGLTSKEFNIDELDDNQREIAVSGERLVFDKGIKTNFREGKGRWHGHVSARIYEGMSWSPIYGIGAKFRFVVYEPTTACYYEGNIRSATHLREILGKHAQDLAHKSKTTEMLLFICKYRLDLVKNTTTWDGEPVEAGAPAYRIEFQSERMFSNTKVTPLNANTEDDAVANENKLIEAQLARGKKVLRLARRVSGLLLQLTVFEIMTPAEMAQAAAEQEEEHAKSIAPPGTLSPIKKDKKGRMRLEVKVAPLFKVIAYEPSSKKKSVLMVPPEASTELAGGGFSPFLERLRRRELAKIVCEALLLTFPKGQGYEIFVPWSGMSKSDTSANAAAGGGKTSKRSTAEQVIKRPGKIFRGGMRISDMDILLTVYSQPAPKASGFAPDARQLIFNFYSIHVSEAIEMLVTDEEQTDRIGRTILSLADGSARAIAIRRFCRNFSAEIIEDPEDSTRKILNIRLVKIKKDFISDYQEVGVPHPGENLRTFGAPDVFMPLHVKGELLYRKVVTIYVKAIKVDVEYIISIYSHKEGSTPDKGLVVRMYERETSDTCVLHIGPSEILRLCVEADEIELLNDIRKNRIETDSIQLDEVESAFVILSEKGDMEINLRILIDKLAEIVINDLGIKKDPQNKDVPYLKSSKYKPL